jgi:hypothetical protein
VSVLLLYAIVPADRVPPSAGSPGGLSVLAHRSVAALYDERDEPPSTSREELVEFGRAVTEIWTAAPCLPVRYGTVLASREQLRELLEQREEEWRERLLVVAGNAELLVHVRDESAPRLAQPARGEPGAGREYLLSRAAARRHTESMLEDLTAHLAPHCRELRQLRASDEVRLACLVPAEDTDKFRAALDAWAAAQDSRRVTVTGPWPPFSFTEEDPT